MANVTPGYSWSSGEIVTPAKMNLAATPTVVVADGEVTAAKLASSSVTSDKIASGAVTSDKIASGAAIPAGAVMSFAMNSAPTGWLACNGAAVSRSTYSALFSAVSTTYGTGDGSTTFNVPDLRGYFVRGWGVAGQNGTNSDGTASGTFAAKQADALKTHTHPYEKNVNTLNAAFGATAFNQVWNGFNGNGSNTGNPSTGTSTETRPKNIAMLYCIKF
jgi:microcystin-dependent protein